MELMDSDFDSFYHFVYKQVDQFVPEKIIAQIALCVVQALHFLRQIEIMHRGRNFSCDFSEL